MNSSNNRNFLELNRKYIDQLIDLLTHKDQEIRTQDKVIALQYEKLKEQEEYIDLLKQSNENLKNICEAAGLI